jgi:hypothetical protein
LIVINKTNWEKKIIKVNFVNIKNMK